MHNAKFWLVRIIDKALEKTPFHSPLAYSGFFRNRGNNRHNRDQHDDYAQSLLQKLIDNRKTLPKVSAIFRVKNAAPFLASSVSSIAAFASEIIIVDNNSSDDTAAIAQQLQQTFSGHCDVLYFSYPQTLAIAGKNYSSTIAAAPEKSLATFYNYCFNKASQDYVMKVDAHCLYQPERLLQLQQQLQKSPDVVYFRGIELYGKKLSIEPYLFKRALKFSYMDSRHYELLVLPKESLSKSVVLSPVFIHIKRTMYSQAVFKQQQATQHLYR